VSIKSILIGALATLFVSFSTASAGPIKLCTASEDGVYHAAGKEIVAMAPAGAITLVTTDGTIDNLRRALDLPKDNSESCDALIGQPDVPAMRARLNKASVVNLKPIAPLHREYVYVLCGKDSGVDDLSDLEDNPSSYSVAIGLQGSGAWATWQNFIAEDEDYKEIPTTAESGIMALTSVATGTTTCAVITGGLGVGTVAEADATFGDTINLVGATDGDFDDATTLDGKDLYEFVKIPKTGAYPRTFDRTWSSVKTVSWSATLYVNTEKLSDKAVQKMFATAGARAANTIRAKYGK
jgi:uncharacterized protein